MTNSKKSGFTRKRQFYVLAALILVGAIGHVLWFFIGTIPEEDHPQYFIANVAFYLSVLELAGLAAMGIWLWLLLRYDLKAGIFVSLFYAVLYFFLVFIFLAISKHPLGLTIWMIVFMLIGAV